AAARGRIPEGLPDLLPTQPGVAVAIVLAAEGDPSQPKRGHPISGLDEPTAQGALVFHAGTVGRPQGGYGTNGGRVLAGVGRGPALAAVRERAHGARAELTR